MKPLSNEMHDAVKHSAVGQFIDRLIREEVARGGDTAIKNGTGGNVIQQLWSAFVSGSFGPQTFPKEEA